MLSTVFVNEDKDEDDVEHPSKRKTRQCPCHFEGLCGTGTLIMEEDARKSRRKGSISSESTTESLGETKRRRMSSASQADLHRVTGFSTCEAFFLQCRLLKKPPWLLPETKLTTLPDSEFTLAERIMDIGGPLTCQKLSASLVLTHILLVQAVFFPIVFTREKTTIRIMWFNSNLRKLWCSPRGGQRRKSAMICFRMYNNWRKRSTQETPIRARRLELGGI